MVFSRGFSGRRRASADLPPGQYLTEDFPVLTAGPTQRVATDTWELTVTTETGQVHRWDWAGLMALPADTPTVDLHCVTRWSKLATDWKGVSLDALLEDIETTADFALITSYGGYTTHGPLEDLTDGKAWVAYQFDGEDLRAEHGGPARLLVPHLYLWKSAKWVRDITLSHDDEPGFWETAGYHNYGDPWREQRYWDE
jgi:DMSO/TMAO reductase YedYZ molybdopterin-dependent catalytic subunit